MVAHSHISTHSVGLPRYDANTLRPLSVAGDMLARYRENSTPTTFPRVRPDPSADRRSFPSYFLPTLLDEKETIEYVVDYGEGNVPKATQRHRQNNITHLGVDQADSKTAVLLSEWPAYKQNPYSILQPPSPLKDYPSARVYPPLTEPEEWRRRLANNGHIGAHRLAFLLKRIPALVMGVIALWFLFGRGVGNASGLSAIEAMLSQQERNAAIAALTTANVALFSIAVYGSHNHNYLHKRAYSQAIWRIVFAVINGAFSIATIVFTSISLGILLAQPMTSTDTSPKLTCYPLQCFSHTERLANTGLILCLAVVIALLSVLTLIFGSYAVNQLDRDGREMGEKRINESVRVAYATSANSGSKLLGH